MTKGGYQILDLSGIPFNSGFSSYVEGAHEKIEGTRKSILVSGIELDGMELRDQFVNFYISGGSFVGKVLAPNGIDYVITVGDSVDGNDPITIASDG